MKRLLVVVLETGGLLAVLVPIALNTFALAEQSQATLEAARGQTPTQQSAKLDQLIAAGKSQGELAQYLFDTQGCKQCHIIGQEGKLGLTKKGKERAQGFEGCISTLKAMSIIAKVPEDQRSVTQRQRAQRFAEFGCASCHRLTPGAMGVTELGRKLANLHLGCVEVEQLVASRPASQR